MSGAGMIAASVNSQDTHQEKAMNRSLTLGLGMLIGAAIGAAAVSGLRAQGKAPGAYAVLDVSEVVDARPCNRLSLRLARQ